MTSRIDERGEPFQENPSTNPALATQAHSPSFWMTEARVLIVFCWGRVKTKANITEAKPKQPDLLEGGSGTVEPVRGEINEKGYMEIT